MDDRNMTLERLTEGNRKLKEDREILLDTLVQMNRTLNRLIEEYVTGVKIRKNRQGCAGAGKAQLLPEQLCSRRFSSSLSRESSFQIVWCIQSTV